MELFPPDVHPATPEVVQLDDQHTIKIFQGVKNLRLSPPAFEFLWGEHPEEYGMIVMRGLPVKKPRWQQAYGKDYRYSGSEDAAVAITPQLQPYLFWCREHIDARLNGLLVNWYDGRLGHYIGKHRDDTRDLAQGSPIVTISLGEARKFRFRPYQKAGFTDVLVENGDVVVIPWRTNQTWTHEIPKSKRYVGRRISVTLRAFN